MVSVKKLRGVSAELAAKLADLGISNSDQLLDAAKTTAKRKELAAKVGVETGDILEAANRADLARVKGIAGIFSDLLEQAGVDTVKELAVRNPANLHAKLAEVNAETKLAGRAPNTAEVESWVQQAKDLPKLLEY
jgi:predicted flap endonuclease-1-like 5' DNA nuclease